MALLAAPPHPDGESTSTGGMLTYYSARDVRTGVVICTQGEEGEIHGPDLDPVADRPRLRELRTQPVTAIPEQLRIWDILFQDSGGPDQVKKGVTP